MLAERLIKEAIELERSHFFKIGPCSITIKGLSGRLKLVCIEVESSSRNTGAARRALSSICSAVDKLMAELYLVVQPLDDDTSFEGLIKLYKSFGFVETNDTEMVRKQTK